MYTFFSAIALAGMEHRPIRLSAATQRALLGYPVFGKRVITVNGDKGTVSCTVSRGFGMDYEQAYYTRATVQSAVNTRKQLIPGVTVL